MINILHTSELKRMVIAKHADDVDSWSPSSDKLYAHQSFENILSQKYQGYLLFNSGFLYGVLSYILLNKQKTIYISNLAVREQKHGYGSMLLGKIIEISNKNGYIIELVSSNIAQTFYQKYGFEQVSNSTTYVYNPIKNDIKVLSHKTLNMMGEN